METMNSMIEDNITKAVKQAIEISIEQVVKTAIQNAKNELDTRIPEIVAGVAIKTMKVISFDSFDNKLVISVHLNAK